MKLSDRWTKQQQQRSPVPYEVEIADCDDVEVYIETLRLMYCKDLRKKLMREDVSRVLGILKVTPFFGVLFFCTYINLAAFLGSRHLGFVLKVCVLVVSALGQEFYLNCF